MCPSGHSWFGTEGRTLDITSRMLQYQVALLEQDNAEFKVTTTLNPAVFLQVLEEAQRPLDYDCLVKGMRGRCFHKQTVGLLVDRARY